MPRPRRTRIGAVLMPAVPPWVGDVEIQAPLVLRAGDHVHVRIEWQEGCLRVELVGVEAVKPRSGE